MKRPPVFPKPRIDGQSVIEAQQRQPGEECCGDEEGLRRYGNLPDVVYLLKRYIPDVPIPVVSCIRKNDRRVET